MKTTMIIMMVMLTILGTNVMSKCALGWEKFFDTFKIPNAKVTIVALKVANQHANWQITGDIATTRIAQCVHQFGSWYLWNDQYWKNLKMEMKFIQGWQWNCLGQTFVNGKWVMKNGKKFVKKCFQILSVAHWLKLVIWPNIDNLF